MIEQTLEDLVNELLELNDENLAKRVIDSNDVQWCLEELYDFLTHDMEEIVRCRDCIYFQDKQIELNDGTYRDYKPGEYEHGSILGGVTSSVGINIGSYCRRVEISDSKFWCNKKDFCSRGKKMEET